MQEENSEASENRVLDNSRGESKWNNSYIMTGSIDRSSKKATREKKKAREDTNEIVEVESSTAVTYMCHRGPQCRTAESRDMYSFKKSA